MAEDVKGSRPRGKSMKYLIAAAAMLSLAACAPPQYQLFGTAGDPDNTSYAGSAGSVYDQTANPPAKVSIATYNPDAPLPAYPDVVPPPSVPLTMPAH